MDIRERVIYRNLKHEELLEHMACLMGMAKCDGEPDPFSCAGQLVDLAARYGLRETYGTVFWRCALGIMKMLYNCL